MRAWSDRAAVLGALACALLIAAVSYQRPQLNWDLLPYVALARVWQGAAPAEAHADAYADVRRLAESRGLEKRADELVSGAYREANANDPAVFAEQLPFYRIRPLYLGLVATLGRVTPTLSDATVLVSVLSALGFCMVLLAVAVRRLGGVEGGLLAGLFALAPTTSDVASSSTPDALAMLLCGVACSLLLRAHRVGGALVLVACSLVRSDIALLNLCLAATMLACVGWRRAGLAAALLAGSILLVAAVQWKAGAYPYAVLYHFTFLERFVPHPASLQGLPLPLPAMLRQTVFGIRYSLDNGGLWTELAFLGVAAGALYRAGAGRDRVSLAVLLAIAGQTALRYVLFPASDVRFAAPGAAMAAMAIATGWRSPRASSGRSPGAAVRP